MNLPRHPQFLTPTSLSGLRYPLATMQSMQRQFGKLLNKAPGDNAKVSALLNDYEDVDKVLAQVHITPLGPASRGEPPSSL